MRSLKRFRAILLPFILCCLPLCGTGCGKKSSHPVAGQVFVKGEPAANARVVLYPTDSETASAVYPSARVGPDGSFQLTTRSKGDGAPAGEYTVTVVWAESHRYEGETVDGPDKLNGKYANPTSTPLKLTIDKKTRELPKFDLE